MARSNFLLLNTTQRKMKGTTMNRYSDSRRSFFLQPLNDFAMKVTVAALVVISILFHRFGWAADGTTKSQDDAYEMEEIVVTATRIETPRSDVAANISVISKEDIKRMPVSNAAEILQYIPGVYVEFNGGLGSDASGIRIQGSETRHVAIYQDNVPLNQLANPLTDLSYLPVSSIDRIEIYKGAASSAWGSALGGVVNIITKEPELKKPVAVDAQGSYGEHDTVKSRGAVSGTIDRFGYLVALTHDESDGFMEHTEYDQDTIYGKINYDVGEASRLDFVYSLDKGSNADPVVNYEDFWDDIHRRHVYERLLFETSPADSLDLTIEGRHHRFYNWIEDVFIDHKEVFNDYEEETWGVSARMSYCAEDVNRGTVGFDLDRGRYDFRSDFIPHYDSKDRNWAIYANDHLNFGNLSFSAGLRYDDNHHFGSELPHRLYTKALLQAQSNPKPLISASCL